jgi:hypothetical protein
MDCIFDGDVGLIAGVEENGPYFDALVDTDPSYYITIQSLDEAERTGVRFSSILFPMAVFIPHVPKLPY